MTKQVKLAGREINAKLLVVRFLELALGGIQQKDSTIGTKFTISSKRWLPTAQVTASRGSNRNRRRLAAATSKDSFYCFEPDSIDIVYWKQCRFPYPGEVSE